MGYFVKISSKDKMYVFSIDILNETSHAVKQKYETES